MKANKPVSTFDRIMKDPKRRRKFGRKYRSFLLSEVIHGLMEKEGKSVRALAREVGISPTVIHDMRTGGRTNVTLRSFLGVVSALGGQVAVRSVDVQTADDNAALPDGAILILIQYLLVETQSVQQTAVQVA